MKVVTNAIPIIQFVPREYPLISDTLVLEFEKGFDVPFNWVLDGDLIELTLSDTSLFKQREKYSFTVLIGSEIIYKGVIVFLKDGTDVQNYTNQSQDNKPWR